METITPPPLRPVCPIKFPMRKERTGTRRGPRFRLRPNKDGLHGAAACAAGMIALAMSYRESERYQTGKVPTAYNQALALLHLRIYRWQVRSAALWARRFSHRIADDDQRFAVLDAEHDSHMRELRAMSSAE